MRPRQRRAALAGLVALYAASRLVGLEALPMFVDESWHISWSLSIAEGLRPWRPWQYGKGLPIFANALLLHWAAGSALWAGRCLTAAFGALTLLATWGLARRLYDDATALVAGALYVLCPFTLFYDRLVLTDPVMSAFAALALLASVRLARSGRLAHGLLAGLALALAVLSKALGVLLLFVPAAAWLALARPLRRALGALALAYAAAGALIAWPLWRFFEVSSAVETALGRSEAGPLERVARNLPLVAEWLGGWWTLPLLLLALLGTLGAAARRQGPGLLLGATWLLPLAALLPTATLWYPRYLLFTSVPALILAARVLTSLTARAAAPLGPAAASWRPALPAAATLLALVPSLRVDADLWSEPSRAPLPAIERLQFIDGWPSGYGVRETLAFVQGELDRHPEGLTVVLNSRSRPTTRIALGVAFRHEPRIKLEDLPLGESGALPFLERWARERPTLVIVPPPRDGRERPAPQAWAALGGVLALETRKPNGELCDQIYRLATPGSG